MSVFGTIIGAFVPWRRPVVTATVKPKRRHASGYAQHDTFYMVWDEVAALPPNHTINVVQLSKHLADDKHHRHAIQQRAMMMVRSGVLKTKGAKPHTRVYLGTNMTREEAYEYHKTWYAEFQKGRRR